MKKIVTMCAFAVGFAVAGHAQSTNNNNSTPQQMMDDLRDCLDSKNVSYSIAPSMNSSQVFLFVAPDTPFGKVNSCMQHYENARTSSSTAPEIILITDPFAF